MKKVILFSVIIALLSGCDNMESQLSGKYIDVGVPSDRLELLNDHTGKLFNVNDNSRFDLSWNVIGKNSVKFTMYVSGTEKVFLGRFDTSKVKNDRLIVSYDNETEKRYMKLPKNEEWQFTNKVLK